MACIYGDVRRIETTGASEGTAKQDDRSAVPGVNASHALARTDLSRMNGYREIITKVARAQQMDPAVICGIISRETRAGAPGLLDNGWGDHGNGFGLMQVDKRWHTPEGQWNSERHLTQATKLLIGFIRQIQDKFPSWSKEQQLKGGISAYNASSEKVPSYEGVDRYTTGGDYANDVVARAQWFKRNGF